MGCPYSEEELQEWDSVANPMGDACFDCEDCDCEHWAGSCDESCDRYWKWAECGGPWRPDPMDEAYTVEEG
jgi:hypothetical protein